MISLAELLRAIPDTVQADGVRLQEMEAAAVAHVESLLGRYFGPPQLVEEFLIGKGGRRLYLRDHPAPDPEYPDDPASALVSESSELGGDATALDASDFVLRVGERESVIVRSGGDVWTKDYEYPVTYWRGYPAGEEPADIRELVIGLVRHRWGMAGKDGLRSETIGGYAWTRFEGSDLEAIPGAKDTIEAWRRPAVA